MVYIKKEDTLQCRVLILKLSRTQGERHRIKR
jgi:hypothetical protein